MYFISPDLGDVVHIGGRFYVYIASSKHKGVGRILESYANEFSKVVQTRDASVQSKLYKYGKKFSIAFTKYFSKLIRQMKGNCVF